MRFLRAYLFAAGAVLAAFWVEFLVLGLVTRGQLMAFVSDQPTVADSLRMTLFYLPYVLVFTLILGTLGFLSLKRLRATSRLSYVGMGLVCGALGAVTMGSHGTWPPALSLATMYAVLGAVGAATFWSVYRPGA